jgi:hypothetical protein
MKLDETHIENIAFYIASGLAKMDACDAARVSRATFYNWINQGRIDYDAGTDSLQKMLFELVAVAETDVELLHLRRITTASKRDWHASAWYLERYRGRVKQPYKPEETTEVGDEITEIG